MFSRYNAHILGLQQRLSFFSGIWSKHKVLAKKEFLLDDGTQWKVKGSSSYSFSWGEHESATFHGHVLCSCWGISLRSTWGLQSTKFSLSFCHSFHLSLLITLCFNFISHKGRSQDHKTPCVGWERHRTEKLKENNGWWWAASTAETEVWCHV